MAPPQSLQEHLRSSTLEYCLPLKVPFPLIRETDANWPRFELPQCGHCAICSSVTGLSLCLLPTGRPAVFFAIMS